MDPQGSRRRIFTKHWNTVSAGGVEEGRGSDSRKEIKKQQEDSKDCWHSMAAAASLDQTKSISWGRLKLDRVIKSHPLLPSMNWKLCICLAMKFAFSFVCLGRWVLITKLHVSYLFGDKHWIPLWELQLTASLFCSRIKEVPDLSRC